MDQQDVRVRFRVFGTGDYYLIKRSRDYRKILGSKHNVRKMMRRPQSEPEKKEMNHA
jgi:hypothetical protein